MEGYQLLRFIVCMTCFIGAILFCKRNEKLLQKIHNSKYFFWLPFAIVVIFMVSFFRIPFESIFKIEFDDIDEYIDYMYGDHTILEVKLSEEEYFVTYNSRGFSRVKLLKRQNNKWTELGKRKEHEEYLDKDVSVQTINYENKVLIYVHYNRENTNGEKFPIVKDSLNNNFEFSKIKSMAYNWYSYKVIENPPSDYYLIVNDRKIDIKI